MDDSLKLTFSSFSSKGRKPLNQDFCDIHYNRGDLDNKGAIFAIADGISSSNVSQEASQIAVLSFIEDYLATPVFWSIEKSANRVIRSINSWLHAKTMQSEYRYNLDQGYVCTLSVVIVHKQYLHLFHIGDGKVFKCNAKGCEQLTTSHRLYISKEQSYLSRAMGMDSDILIDYTKVPLEVGDDVILLTDGVTDVLSTEQLQHATTEVEPNTLANVLVEQALEKGADDNVTAVTFHVQSLELHDKPNINELLLNMPLLELGESEKQIDNLRLKRELHHGPRSRLFLVEDSAQNLYVLKLPSVSLQNNTAYLEQFAAEEWIARKLHSKHLLAAAPSHIAKAAFYTLFEYVDGKSLAQWLHDNPHPSLDTVRSIAQQLAMGLHAMHKNEMIHQDLRLENIMIDHTNSITIIDFGSTYMLGVDELNAAFDDEMPGTPQFLAPEYFIGELGTKASDIYSVGVILYQLLTHFESPYGNGVARAKTKKAQKRLFYQSLLHHNPKIPPYIDVAIKKAVAIDPSERYQEVSELIYDLTHPNRTLLHHAPKPLIQRHPQLVWQLLTFTATTLLIICIMTH